MKGRARRRGPEDLALVTVLAVALGACGKGKAADVPAASASGSAVASAEPVPTVEADDGGMDAMEAALWTAARPGEAEDLMRLADRVGCEGLRERADGQPSLRPIALGAMRYCRDFSELPWLARVANEGSDDDARAALDAAIDLAARPRRSVDPEDADDLHVGCGTLLGLARATDRPRDRRVLAIRALRMLSEYGCVKRADVPTDLDAH